MEWLADNGSCFTAHETVAFAHAIGLVPCFTPVRSPQSNGIAEAFVKTFKRDYTRLNAAPTPLRSWPSSIAGSKTTTRCTRTTPSGCARPASSPGRTNPPPVRLTGATPLGHIARLDRRWFRARPERRHRCRWPDIVELDLYDRDRNARSVMAVRHFGRGYIFYQPVIFQGDPPGDERSAAALFALAATSSEPIPVVLLRALRCLQRGLRQQAPAKRRWPSPRSVRTCTGVARSFDRPITQRAIVVVAPGPGRAVGLERQATHPRLFPTGKESW